MLEGIQILRLCSRFGGMRYDWPESVLNRHRSGGLMELVKMARAAAAAEKEAQRLEELKNGPPKVRPHLGWA